MLGELSAPAVRARPSSSVRDKRLARVERGVRSASLDSGSALASGRRREEVTGPPWPFAGNPLTPQTSGGNHMHRTRVRAGTAPLG